jgi:hypothetical protein
MDIISSLGFPTIILYASILYAARYGLDLALLTITVNIMLQIVGIFVLITCIPLLDELAMALHTRNVGHAIDLPYIN